MILLDSQVHVANGRWTFGHLPQKTSNVDLRQEKQKAPSGRTEGGLCVLAADMALKL
jgi:hypothetical protein